MWARYRKRCRFRRVNLLHDQDDPHDHAVLVSIQNFDLPVVTPTTNAETLAERPFQSLCAGGRGMLFVEFVHDAGRSYGRVGPVPGKDAVAAFRRAMLASQLILARRSRRWHAGYAGWVRDIEVEG
jgi:hypothetical protein